ncbi:MAG: FtsH protease activity modulator HflK [Alphaproteobacteria bacterium]|nr:FtsH protease activity modulator HflK [Alphaproteobacteria bacterium]
MAEKNNPWETELPPEQWEPKVLVSKKETSKVAKFPNIKDNFEFPKLKIVLGVLVLLWLASGFYQVSPSEQGVVLRFGKYVDTTDAGLHYHLPYPVEQVVKVNVTQERSINLGVAEAVPASNRYYNNNSSVALNSFTESHMLTGDENIVDINLTVVWKIKDAKDYLFNVRSPDVTVRVAAQSVLREIVGQSEMQPIITGDRGKVEEETKEELQKVLDDFGSGIVIVRVKLQKADPPKQVVDAFNEVQRAKADMERYKNEAEAYRNEVLPKAKGEAAKRIQEAEAYKQAVIDKANGDAQRFNLVYDAYKQGKKVTAKRLYLETMEDVLSKSDTVIIDPSAKGSNVLPVLPIK